MGDEVFYVEDKWQCSSCGHTNRGRDMRCEKCGSPKEGHEQYIPGSASDARVTDSEMLRQARAGRHWECRFCLNDVRDLEAKECTYCGAPRDQIKAVEKGYKYPSASTYEKKTHYVYLEDANPAPNKKDLKLAEHFSYIAIILSGIGIVAGLWWLLMPHEKDVAVQQLAWSCTKQLQQRETRHGSGWGTPSGSFNETCERRYKGTERCHPHDCNAHQESYSCRPHSCNCTPSCSTSCSSQGNGYSKCTRSCSTSCSTCYDTCYRTAYDTCWDDCPVYDNWCEYDYYAWPTIKTLRTQGSKQNFACPVMKPADLQRVKTSTAFDVKFTDGEEVWSIEPGVLSDFQKYAPNAKWRISVNRAGSVRPLQAL